MTETDRWHYILEKIEFIYKEYSTITAEKIYAVMQKAKSVKYRPKNLQEVADLLDFVKFHESQKQKQDQIPEKSEEELPGSSLTSSKIQIICTNPECGAILYYKPNPNTKRYHKECPKCHQNIEINLTEQKKLQTQYADQIQKKPWIRIGKTLSRTDRAILKLLTPAQPTGEELPKLPELTQKEIQTNLTEKRSLSTVSRRLKKLIAAEIVLEIPTSIRLYKLNLKLNHLSKETEEDPTKINVIATHHVRFHIPITNGEALTAEEIKKVPEVQSIEIQAMGRKNNPTWYKKNVIINDIYFEFCYHVVMFHMPGWGRTVDAAQANLLRKAHDVQKFLQHHFPQLHPQDPIQVNEDAIGDKGAHFVPLRMTPEELDIRQKIWNDNSHPYTVETYQKEFADEIARITVLSRHFEEDLTILKTKMAHIATATSMTSTIETIEAKFEQKIDQMESKFMNNLTKLTENIGKMTETILQSQQSSVPLIPPNRAETSNLYI